MFCLRALNIVHRGFSNTRYLRYNFYNKNLYTLNVYKPKIILKSFINSNNRNLFSIQKCSFHTTPKRYNPLITTIARQFVKVIAIFAGRYLMIENQFQIIYKTIFVLILGHSEIGSSDYRKIRKKMSSLGFSDTNGNLLHRFFY